MLSRMLTLPLILSALILHLEWIFADQTAGATCKDNAALLDRIFDLNARIQQEQMKIMRLEKQLSAPQPSTPQPRNLTNLESFHQMKDLLKSSIGLSSFNELVKFLWLFVMTAIVYRLCCTQLSNILNDELQKRDQTIVNNVVGCVKTCLASSDRKNAAGSLDLTTCIYNVQYKLRMVNALVREVREEKNTRLCRAYFAGWSRTVWDRPESVLI